MKEFESYFEDSMKWIANYNLSDPEFFALLDAKIRMDNDLRLEKTAPLESLKQELLPLSGFIACVQSPSKSGTITAGSEVIVRGEHEYRWCAMFDSAIVKGSIEDVEINEQSINITIKLNESIKSLTLYAQGIMVLKNQNIYKDNMITGKIIPKMRTNFLPQRQNPFFMLYQTSILPEQHSFFDLDISLPAGIHILQLSAYSSDLSLSLNCVLIINTFKHISSYYPFNAREGVYKIPCDCDILEVTKIIGQQGSITEFNLEIEGNIAKIGYQNNNELLSIEALCISSPVNNIYKIQIGVYDAIPLTNPTNITFKYDNLYEIMTKNIFHDDSIIAKVNQMYQIPNLHIKITLTDGIAIGEYWKRVCPKYCCTINVNQIRFLPFAIGWALTLQKLCDINRLCESKIITPIGNMIIKDPHE